MLMTRPWRRSAILGTSSRQKRNGARAFTAISCSYASSSVFRSGAESGMPALFTSTSGVPPSARIRMQAWMISSGWDTSTCRGRTLPFATSTSFLSSWSERARAQTAKPASASRSAMARPIPREAPLTTAIRCAGSMRASLGLTGPRGERYEAGGGERVTAERTTEPIPQAGSWGAERLIFEHVVDGLLKGIGARFTARLDQRMLEAGWSGTKKRMPAYPLATWRAFLRIAREELFPGETEAAGYVKLGELFANGYFQTTLGSAIAAVARLLGPTRPLVRATQQLRAGNNFTETKVTQLG